MYSSLAAGLPVLAITVTEITGLVVALGLGGILGKLVDNWIRRRNKKEDQGLNEFEQIKLRVGELEKTELELTTRNIELETAMAMLIDFIEDKYPDSETFLKATKKLLRNRTENE